MLSRSHHRRHLHQALFLAGIGLILVLGIPLLLHPPTTAADRSQDSVVISEFMAAGQSLWADEDGEYPDWIELHNRGSRPANLLGWSLTDNPDEPDKWMLPQVDLPPGGYLVIFASGKDRPLSTGSPKDIPPQRLIPPLSLHTNFKLQAEDGYLALHDNTSRRFLDAVAFTYPKQLEAVAYGRCSSSNSACYLPAPTPGQANDEAGAWQGLAAPVRASVPHGFYDAPFEVTLATEPPDAVIWYTTDGSEPAEGQAQVYGAPLAITSTTVLRATAVKPGYLAAPPATFSYIFPQQVAYQPDNPPAFPATWGTYRDALAGYTAGAPAAADYAMDPDIVDDPKYRGRVRDSLLALPSLVLVTGIENLDIYFKDPLAQGIEAERPVSVEWIDPADATAGFQVDAGLRLQGHLGRSELVPKHSLRLLFKKAYGPAQLEYELFPGSPVASFDTLVLRAGNNESFAGHPSTKSRLATYAKDEWLRRSQLAVSGFGVHGRFVHLYLNGLYWGVYNLVERPDASFAAATFGGDKEEWLTAKPSSADDGVLCRIDSMRRLAELGGMADPASYAAIQKFVDPVQFSDYLLTEWYAGVDDWPENNWTIGMQQPESPFLFLAWDGELSWVNGADVQLGIDAKQDRAFPNIIKRLFDSLIFNPDFRMILADRLYKQTSPGGALSDAEASTRWKEITGELEPAILAESARWGDAWYDNPITPEEWARSRDQVLGQMNGNAAKLLAAARAQGYYPPIDPPVLSQGSTNFTNQMKLEMAAAQGDIYYTLDGADPRLPVTGAVSPAAMAYTDPIELTSSTRVRARALANGVWSALNEADFNESSQPTGLRITEMMYHPLGGDRYEFIELTNVGAFDVDLSGATFDGIDLRFDRPTHLASGATLVLAADGAAFQERYPGIPVAGIYSGKLSDRGEKITLRSIAGEPLVSFTFDDENGWPLTADGQGDSLVLADLAGDMNDPRSWQVGQTVNGTPGAKGWTVTTAVVPSVSDVSSPPLAAKDTHPSTAVDVRFGDDLHLSGYDLHLNGRPLAPNGLPVVRPGAVLDYVLHWRSGQLKGKAYHGFVQLTTPDGAILDQDDHPAGLILQPASNCSTNELVPDRFSVRIPAEAANGIVRPVVGGYVADSAERLPAYAGDGVRLGDDFALPALKIVRDHPAPTPQSEAHARFGDHIELLGYSLAPSQAGVQPGQPLTVTLFFKTETAIEEDLTRFVQLYSPKLGMAGQNDSQPAQGRNPTWAWQPGETIVDEFVLTIASEAAPGQYTLLVGFYRPPDSVRLPVQDQAGNAAPDQALILAETTVTAASAAPDASSIESGNP